MNHEEEGQMRRDLVAAARTFRGPSSYYEFSGYGVAPSEPLSHEEFLANFEKVRKRLEDLGFKKFTFIDDHVSDKDI